MVPRMIGNHDTPQAVALGNAAGDSQHDAVAERHHCRFHVLVIIVAVGDSIGTLEQCALEVLVHEVQWNNQVLDAQALTVHDGTAALTAVLGAAVVKGDGQGNLVLVLIEHGCRVHAARSNDYRVFFSHRYINRYGSC